MKLVWFRNDLRVADNPALFRACDDAAGQGVLAVAAICPAQWASHDESPARVEFWLANLRSLQQQLTALGIPLKILHVDTFADLPGQLLSLARRFHCDGLYLNREYCLNENLRDKQVVARCREAGIPVYGLHGDLILAPGKVMNGQGLPFRVFTPFSKTWRKIFTEQYPVPLPVPPVQPPVPDASLAPDVIPDNVVYAISNGSRWLPSLWPVGTESAHARLTDFVANRVGSYAADRDSPSMAGTSGLSPYLSCGVISPRQCLAAMSVASEGTNWLNNQWVTEIIWREFYRHLMMHFPDMNRWEPFRPEVESRIRWLNDDRLFVAWCRGETGYPIVDAGMKQLLATGWMHNRLRMITASFLTKLLRQDWRKGARFFMNHLIDGDFASNLGGWQWSASVGADAAPYFRIFSPMRQAERFDPKGDYVAHWLPELRELKGMQRHDPAFAAEVGRPSPIIDYGKARAASLADYQRQ
ncbi:cryptochrome/photolyase family protein [Porticoccus sp.]|uniref:cryptochrome/photolyase family protein n=1 Tax=Porticoccus sp. TaxID=2024853 RepID=UPI003F694E81